MNRLGLSPYGDEDAKTGNYDDEIHSPVRGLMLAVPVSILFWLMALATCGYILSRMA